MKFALIALVATASAIQVREEGGKCVTNKESNQVFDAIDTNHNGQVSAKELRTAIEQQIKEGNMKAPTKAEVAAFKKAAYADAGADKTLNQKEFNKLANQVCAYIKSH